MKLFNFLQSHSEHSAIFLSDRVRSLAMLVTHSLTDSLTDSLTNCRLVNLIDVTLACEDANSELVEVVTVTDLTVADVDAKKRVDEFGADLGAEVWS